jgi:hypothetical protein
MLTPRDLAARAAGQSFASEAEVNGWLASQGITDPTERLSYKIQLMAQGGLASDQHHAPGTLATDLNRHTPETAPLSPELQALFRRARLEPGRAYSQTEVEDLLTTCGMGPTERIAVKAELTERGWLRASGSRHVKAGWDLSAKAAPRGQVLTDRAGQPLVLRSRP